MTRTDGLSWQNGCLYVTLGQWKRLAGTNQGHNLCQPLYLLVRVKVPWPPAGRPLLPRRRRVPKAESPGKHGHAALKKAVGNQAPSQNETAGRAKAAFLARPLPEASHADFSQRHFFTLMVTFFLASLLALSPIPNPATTPQPLPLKDRRFQYAVSPLAGAARTLLVTPATGHQAPQAIALRGPAAQQPAQNIVLRDVNFDGQPDLMLTSAQGNVNSQYTYWLYNAATRRFVRSKALSNAIGGYEVKFDEARQQIVTASRFSCCEHQTRTYAFQQGALKLLATKTDKAPTK